MEAFTLAIGSWGAENTSLSFSRADMDTGTSGGFSMHPFIHMGGSHSWKHFRCAISINTCGVTLRHL